MLDHNGFHVLVAQTFSVSAPGVHAVMGYVGLGPGQEFIPYFLALLGMLLTALIAVLQWPFVALLRLLRGKKANPGEPREGEGVKG